MGQDIKKKLFLVLAKNSSSFGQNNFWSFETEEEADKFASSLRGRYQYVQIVKSDTPVY